MQAGAETMSLFTVIGTAITTAGTIIVALITTKTRRDQKTIQKETESGTEESKQEILAALKRVENGLANNSRVTVANARAMISQIYTEHKDDKKISEKTWQNVLELHEAYKSVKIDGHTPNSWCDAIVDEMKTWDKQ